MTDYLLPKETGIKRKRSFEKVSILTKHNKHNKDHNCSYSDGELYFI
jgi:hypothetical protein